MRARASRRPRSARAARRSSRRRGVQRLLVPVPLAGGAAEATAAALPFLSSAIPDWVDVEASATRGTTSPASRPPLRSATTAVCSAIRSGSASSTRATPGEGHALVAEAEPGRPRPPPSMRRWHDRRAPPARADRDAPERPVHGGRPCEVRMTGCRGSAPCAGVARAASAGSMPDYSWPTRAAPRACAGSARSPARASAIGGAA